MNIHKIIAPVLRQFRQRRMRRFESAFGLTERTRILDVGGTPFNWAFTSVRTDVTLLNLDTEHAGAAKGMRFVVGDGCRLPFRDGAFDIVFSNSVIEHVPVAKRAALAAEIARVGRTFFVQTPSKWFPLEPHFLTPFFQYWPLGIRRKLARRGTVWGWIVGPSDERARALVDEINLLGPAEFRRYFPDARLRTESLLGWPKSLIIEKLEAVSDPR